MIHYHGGPITPDTCAIRAWKGRHGFVSFSDYRQLGLASEICQSFGLDNGAFPEWQKIQKGKQKKGFSWEKHWDEYMNDFLPKWINHPRCDFAIIPDQIGFGEKENDELIEQWKYGFKGVPVWHMDESDERLIRLANEWPRVAIGSCGEYDVKRPTRCVQKLHDVLRHIVDENGHPITKLHGLRMLNNEIFSKVPLSSADSTNVARNIGLDNNWTGAYQPKSKETRASIMVERIESVNSSSTYPPKGKEIEIVKLQLGFHF